MSNKPIEEIIEASSLGAESARAAIESVSPEHGRLIVAIAEQRAKTESLAKHLFRYGNPNLTGEEHDRLLGMWEEVDDMVRTIWMDLADVAYIHMADEIDSEKEALNKRVADALSVAREARDAGHAYFKWGLLATSRAEKAEAKISKLEAELDQRKGGE